MDSLEVNKSIAALLVAGIVFFLCGVIGESLVHPIRLKESAIKVEVAEAPAAAGAKEEPPAPIGPLLAAADPAAGGADTKKLCSACHTFDQGGKNGVGPNLYDVLSRGRAHEAGFAYSKNLAAKAGDWTYDDLNAWLKKPSAFSPGTKMAFVGIKSDKERANVIAYLRSLSPAPKPLPQ